MLVSEGGELAVSIVGPYICIFRDDGKDALRVWKSGLTNTG